MPLGQTVTLHSDLVEEPYTPETRIRFQPLHTKTYFSVFKGLNQKCSNRFVGNIILNKRLYKAVAECFLVLPIKISVTYLKLVLTL